MIRLLDIVMLAIVGVGTFFGIQVTLINLGTPKAYYLQGERPPFRALQDYTGQTFEPFVRLENMNGEFICSATVISDDYALTAAHCVLETSLLGVTSLKDNLRTVGKPLEGRYPAAVDSNVVEVQAVAAGVRADYALVKGDFKLFTKAPISVSPRQTEQIVGPIIMCGYPYGDSFICYTTNNQISPHYGHFQILGQLYPGMSGGPVIDYAMQRVIGVNTAVGAGSVFFAPLVGLFVSLDVEVLE